MAVGIMIIFAGASEPLLTTQNLSAGLSKAARSTVPAIVLVALKKIQRHTND